MKRIIFIFLSLLPAFMYAQFIGVAGQVADSKGQFAATMSAPYKILGNDDHAFQFVLSSGMEYTTSGPKISGLNFKPISVWMVGNNMESPISYGLRLDGGYNFNLTHGQNGVIVTPNLYLDWSVFYVSAGYDYNISHKQSQFYVRMGVGITLGLLKKIGGKFR
ncbi:MAG: hypothetical protein ACK5KT_02305 [Dysgonomonas sp.]